ncbi:MAG: alpha/beta hydrolase [Flavobacteriales bacterium]|nr:MAG: alpha/beta hydrolase [Flavobacteriales bacterium]
MKKTIYFIPGLGADDTIFKNLKIPGYDIVHIEWVKPHNKEPLPDYAQRLVEQIKPDTIPIIAGLSFGGMVTIELAKIINPFACIIISSIKTNRERSPEMLLGSILRPNRFIPSLLAIRFEFWYHWAFGELTAEEKEWVRNMAESIDPDFTDWAVDTALQWQNEEVPKNLVHIHGTKDNIFPIKYIKDCIVVEGGTHFMVANKAEEVSKIIVEEIKKKDKVPS